MAADKSFNWGIIGPGKIAHGFAKDLALVKNAKLHAVASRSIDRARSFAEAYGAQHSFGDYQSIVECPDLDAIYIATPHTSHAEYAIFCLNHKIPVLCEKPLAMNRQQVQSMIEAAKSNNTFLMEALWTRFLPTTLQVIEMVNNGAIGKVEGVKADFGFRTTYNPDGRLFNPELGGGSLLDVGIYPIFLSYLLLGKPETIQAMVRKAPTGVDEDCAMLFQYTGGAIAQLHSSLISNTKTEGFIYGQKGTIHMHARWHESSSFSLLIKGERPEDARFDFSGKGYTYEIEEVIRSVQDGKTESALWTLQNSLELMEILDAVRGKIGVIYAGLEGEGAR